VVVAIAARYGVVIHPPAAGAAITSAKAKA
jgi:hypothetical protein